MQSFSDLLSPGTGMPGSAAFGLFVLGLFASGSAAFVSAAFISAAFVSLLLGFLALLTLGREWPRVAAAGVCWRNVAANGRVCPGGTRFASQSLFRCAPLLVAGLLVAGSVGCQQRVASQLQGRWEGRPDTAASRAAREAEKFGKISADLVNDIPTGESLAGDDSAGNDSAGNVSVGNDSADNHSADNHSIGNNSIGAESVGGVGVTAEVTDWERYDVTIHIDFVSTDHLELALDGGQPRSGRWKIIATSPTGCTIEVQTETTNAKQEQPIVERRRFELLLDQREGTCVGFLLTEAGADRQQGAIYFRRTRSDGTARSH